MKASTPKKRMGRPPTGRMHQTALALPKQLLDGLDKLARQQGVTRGVEHASLVRSEELVEHLAVPAQRLHRSLFILTHHAAVTEDIGHQDRCQTPFDR